MTTSPPADTRVGTDPEPEGAAGYPPLRVVPADETPEDGSVRAESATETSEYPESESDSDSAIEPEAPWQYRLGKVVADASDALPSLWSARPPSFAERVQYSFNGDWTTQPEGQSGKRFAHLLGTLLCLAVDGLIVTPLRACTTKPSRLFLLLAALLLLGYAL